MARLTLRLFGPGALVLDDEVIRLHSAKTFALLTFLALETSRPHKRERLATLLWGDLKEASARQSLRQALYSLRTVGSGRMRDRVDTDNDLIAFKSDRGVDIDVQRFLECVRSADVQRWSEAAALYRAPILDGRAFEDCEEFEQWLVSTRERFHALALQNLDRLIIDRMSQADLAGALRYAECLRDLDPTSEAATRHLFRILAARNEPQAIEEEWARLRALLSREFGVEPSRETEELRKTVSQAGVSPSLPAQSTGSRSYRASQQGGSLNNSPDAEPFIRAARAAERVHAFSQAADLYDRALMALEHCIPAEPQRRCDVLLYKEAALERLGLRAEQAEAVDQALAIAEQLGEKARIASASLRKAGACTYLGDRDGARRAAERALEIYRGLGDLPGEAEALRELAFVHWQTANYQTALRYAREALALHRRIGDVAGEASALHNLAEIHRDLGSPRQAMEWYKQALKLHWAARSHEGEILTLFGMANALHQTGDVAGSTRRYAEALKLSETHGERTMQSRALHALATRHAAQKDLDAALSLMRRAIEVDRAIGYAHGLGHDLVDLAHIHVERGERADARAVLREALIWFDFTGNHNALASAQALIADLESDRPVEAPAAALRPGVKSHLSFGEGKVYCAFESPLGMRAHD